MQNIENFYPKNNSRYYLPFNDEKVIADTKVSQHHKTSFAKKTADITATALWLTVVGFFVYKTGLLNKKAPENILNKAKSIEAKYDKLEKMTELNQEINIDEKLRNKNWFQKLYIKTLYKLGEHFQTSKTKMGSELYNNLINSAGKLFIMPLVIFANPFGKKKTSKEDKISITIREPLSVIATFTLQGCFDKMFNIYMPKILKKNIFESKEIQEEFKKNGKISPEHFELIKFNPSETKRIFAQLPQIEVEKGGLKGILTTEQAKRMITINPFDSEGYDSYMRAFQREIENGEIPKEHLVLITKKFKVVADSIGHYELAKIKPKIAMNIVAVVIISRIFLNVIHGKTMKLLNLKEKSNDKN